MFRTWTLRSKVATRTLLRVLKISENFTPEQLQKGYITECKRLHPDVNNGLSNGFLAVQKAHEICKNPALYKKYLSMTSEENKIFDDMWKAEFGHREAGIEAVNYIEKFVTLGDDQRLKIAGTAQTYYDWFSALRSKPKTNGQKRLSISLDVSGSMFSSSNQPKPDADRMTSEEFQKHIRENQSKRKAGRYTLFDESVDAVRDFITGIGKYEICLFEFSDETKRLLHRKSPEKILSFLKSYVRNKGNGTELYKTIAEQIDQIPDQDLKSTTFVVLTDGFDNEDYNLDILLSKIVDRGEIRIIIIGIGDVVNTKELNMIVKAAKYGRLLRSGERLEFPTVKAAFSAAKDLVLIRDSEENAVVVKIRNQFGFK